MREVHRVSVLVSENYIFGGGMILERENAVIRADTASIYNIKWRHLTKN